MIKEDYRKYLSYDNGKGLLIPMNDIRILELYQVPYQECSSLKNLIFMIKNILDYDEDNEDLIEVIDHLEEIYYYQEVHK